MCFRELTNRETRGTVDIVADHSATPAIRMPVSDIEWSWLICLECSKITTAPSLAQSFASFELRRWDLSMYDASMACKVHEHHL